MRVRGFIATAVCKLTPVLLRVSFAKSGPAELAFGVGQRSFLAIVSREGLTFPVLPPPTFVP